MVTGDAEVLPTLFNFVWVGLDLALISVVVQAARYRGFEPGSTASPPSSIGQSPTGDQHVYVSKLP